MNRREFLEASAAAAAVSGLPSFGRPLEGARAPRLKKAVKLEMVREPESVLAKFELLKRLGFDGVECSRPSPLPIEELLEASKTTGLPIHGVVDSVHWSHPLSSPDDEIRRRGREGLEQAVKDAEALGAESVLLVPGMVDADTRYDECYERSQAEVRRVLPLAESLGIRILFENVWNNFLLSPMEAARYLDELESPLVGMYFDVGNVVRYGWPEHWVRILGKRIGKLDVKEYSRKKQMDEGPWKGFQVEIGDGDCGWAKVMAALDEIGYSGWATAEVGGGGEERLRDVKERMDRVLG